MFGERQRCHFYVLDNKAVEEAHTDDAAVPVLDRQCLAQELILQELTKQVVAAVQRKIHRTDSNENHIQGQQYVQFRQYPWTGVWMQRSTIVIVHLLKRVRGLACVRHPVVR